jgi:predicted transposase YdaD
MDARYAAKWKLVQLLYQRDWDKQRIIDLFLVLDWMMRLPVHLKQELCHNIELLEESEKMRYVSSVEQVLIERVMQQGMQQGRQEGEKKGEALALQRLLTKRFGTISSDVTAKIAGATVEQIEAWFDLAIDAAQIADVFGGASH